jgi:hypothetical protein
LLDHIIQYAVAYAAIFIGLLSGGVCLLVARNLHQWNAADSIVPTQLGSALVAVSLGVAAFLIQGNIDRNRKDQETFDGGVSRLKVSWNISELAVDDLTENLQSFKDVKTCGTFDPAARSEFRKFLRSPANALTLTPLADSLRETVFTGPLASKIDVTRAARIEIYEKRYLNDLTRAASNVEAKLEALILQIDRRALMSAGEIGDICSALNDVAQARMRALMSVSIAAALKCDLIAQLTQDPAQLPTKETFREMEWAKTPAGLPEFRGTSIDSGWRVAARDLPDTKVGDAACNRYILDLVPGRSL